MFAIYGFIVNTRAITRGRLMFEDDEDSANILGYPVPHAVNKQIWVIRASVGDHAKSGSREHVNCLLSSMLYIL